MTTADQPTSAAWPDIDQAGLAGLHTWDCWDSETHEDCRKIVAAVLGGLADGNWEAVYVGPG